MKIAPFGKINSSKYGKSSQIIIGRISEDNFDEVDIYFAKGDNEVSRSHACIELCGRSGYRIFDLGSTLGTKVELNNYEGIAPLILQENMVIQFSEY